MSVFLNIFVSTKKWALFIRTSICGVSHPEFWHKIQNKFHMMLKKRVNWFLSKKKTCFGRAVEGLFLSKAGPKRGWLSYLIAIIRKETSDLWRITLNVIRYEKYPLFGPALDKKEPSTTRPKQGFIFWTAKLILSVDLFLASSGRLFTDRTFQVKKSSRK